MRAGFLGLCGVVLILAWGCDSSGRDKKVGSTRSEHGSHSKADIEKAEPEPEAKILPETFLAAAQLAESRGEMPLAVSMYRKAIALKHDYVEAYNGLGLLYEKAGDYRQAEQAFSSAISPAPDKGYLRNNLAFCLLRQRRLDEAERELRQAIELEPDLAKAHVNLGVVLACKGRDQAALDEFLKVLPSDGAHYNLGLLYESNRQPDKARAAYAHALTLNPEMEAAQQGLKRLMPAEGSAVARTSEAHAVAKVTEKAAPADVMPVEAEPASAVVVEPRVPASPERGTRPTPAQPAAVEEVGPPSPPASSEPLEAGPTSQARPAVRANVLAARIPAPQHPSGPSAMSPADTRLQALRELTDLIYEARVWWAGSEGVKVRQLMDGLALGSDSQTSPTALPDPVPPVIHPSQMGGTSVASDVPQPVHGR
jgi:tetratricopeptide (TPR) repeat protein